MNHQTTHDQAPIILSKFTVHCLMTYFSTTNESTFQFEVEIDFTRRVTNHPISTAKWYPPHKLSNYNLPKCHDFSHGWCWFPPAIVGAKLLSGWKNTAGAVGFFFRVLRRPWKTHGVPGTPKQKPTWNINTNSNIYHITHVYIIYIPLVPLISTLFKQ